MALTQEYHFDRKPHLLYSVHKLIGLLQFDQYQEQAYLLDPYLEQLFAPVVETLKTHAKKFVSSSSVTVSKWRLHRLSLLVYHFIKFRGYKTMSRSSFLLTWA